LCPPPPPRTHLVGTAPAGSTFGGRGGGVDPLRVSPPFQTPSRSAPIHHESCFRRAGSQNVVVHMIFGDLMFILSHPIVTPTYHMSIFSYRVSIFLNV